MLYFLTNPKWYFYDRKAFCYHLTGAGESIPEVVASYEEYYTPTLDEDGEIVDL